MKAKATLRLKFSSERKLRIVLNSLKPEVHNAATIRSHTSMKREDKYLVLKIEANDTVALRASLNAYLRWISSIFNVFEIMETQ